MLSIRCVEKGLFFLALIKELCALRRLWNPPPALLSHFRPMRDINENEFFWVAGKKRGQYLVTKIRSLRNVAEQTNFHDPRKQL